MLIENGQPFIPKKNPVERPDHTTFIVNALRALMNGVASPRQQREAMEYIVNQVCGTYDMAYRPDSDRDTVFALGKQHCGATIRFMLQDAETNTDSDKMSARSAMEIAEEGEPDDVDQK